MRTANALLRERLARRRLARSGLHGLDVFLPPMRIIFYLAGRDGALSRTYVRIVAPIALRKLLAAMPAKVLEERGPAPDVDEGFGTDGPGQWFSPNQAGDDVAFPIDAETRSTRLASHEHRFDQSFLDALRAWFVVSAVDAVYLQLIAVSLYTFT